MIAFDYGGTLETIPALRDEVSRLNRLGWPVCCISAVSEDKWTETRRQEILALRDSGGNPLMFAEIRIFTHASGVPELDVAVEAGKTKARLMRELGATLLYDDHPIVCEEVSRAGLLVVRAGVEMRVIPEAAIAFDYGGTLRLADGHEWVRAMVAHLNQKQVPVVVISAIEEPPGRHDDWIREEILALTGPTGEPLVFAAIRFVYYPANPTPADMARVGSDKAAVMRELGAMLLLDDSRLVVEAVRQAGFTVVPV